MKTLFSALRISLVLLLICGLLYPLAMTGLSQLIFPKQSNGSLVEYNGKPVGSELLGQAYTDMRFFHGRVSAVNYNTYKKEDLIPDKDGKTAYTGVSSGSANLAPSNPALVERVKKDIAGFIKAHPEIKKKDIPTDLLTSSGSGLDSNISPAAARIQIPAVAKATGLSIPALNKLVARNTEGRQWGIFGEPRVNVLRLNLGVLELLNKMKQ